MDEKSCLIYAGQKFSLEWYFDKDGKSSAKEFYEKSTKQLKAKFIALAMRLGDLGKINDKTKFRHEGDGIYAFKPQPDRYLSFFTDDKKVIVTNGFIKKADKLPKKEINKAIKCRADYLERREK